MTSCIVRVFLLVCATGVTCIDENDWHFKGSNVALHKHASQKPGTFRDFGSLDIGYPASLAVDGNDSSKFTDGSCSHTSASSNGNQVAQWSVVLDGEFIITGIIIVNRKDFQTRKRLKGFIVYGWSNTTQTWYEIYGDIDSNYTAHNREKIFIPVDHLTPFSIIAIKIFKHTGAPDHGVSYLSLCEVKVYAVTCRNMNVKNGHLSPSQFPYTATNAQATISCNNGFNPTTQSIRCLANGTWEGSEACHLVKCDYPRPIDNGYYAYLNGSIYISSLLPFKSLIIGMCNDGYESDTTEIRECKITSSWSGKTPVCSKIFCPYPGNLTNGSYVFMNRSLYSSGFSVYKTVVMVECTKGYRLNGSVNLTCTSNKMWDNIGTCETVTCDFPEQPDNGHYATKHINGTFLPYSHGPSFYLDKIYSICPEGRFLISESEVRQCLETGLWSGENGRCNLVICPRLSDLVGGINNYSQEPVSGNLIPYKTVVTAECEETYTLEDQHNKHRLCTMTGAWDKDLAVCVPVSADSSSDGSQLVLICGISAAVVFLFIISMVGFIFVRRRTQCRRNKREDTNMQYANLTRNSTVANHGDGDYAVLHGARSSSGAENASTRLDTKKESRSADTLNSSAVDEDVIKTSMSSSTSLQFQHAYYSFTNVFKMPKTARAVKDLSDLSLTGYVAKGKFEKEFQNLPQGMVEKHKEAMKRQNVGKNRYKNLYAYDNTRVVLDTEDSSQSDYINACYVDGFETAKQYIASQGPTTDILTDFWRMLWQTECGKVVMLTNITEEGTTKCEQYWPEEGSSSSYGGITVNTEKTENFSQFVIRTFEIRNENCTKKSKTITQFHFTAWPENGVPKYASSLVQFLNKVKYAPAHGKGPIIVHCSAGIGRTGIFIALDYLTDQGKTMGFVDVIGTLASMRTQRVSLVQTLEQYIFVHKALIESLLLASLSVAMFHESYKELLHIDKDKKKRKICVEFETLKHVSPVADESEYVSSKLVRNRHKDRYSDVLPVEEFMPSLMSNSDNGDSHYINAVFLSSYKDKKAFIITQTPLESTKDDFWGLVWEHNVHTMVMMNNIAEMTDSERYWPDNSETTTFANIEITNSCSEGTNDHQVVSLSVKKHKETRKIKQIRCGKWSSKHNLPDSPEVILNLIELVQASQQQSGNHTILVHCMNGADKSGLYCVISAVIERLKIEQDVAIAQVIEEMRNAREQIIPSVEQYQFCHEAVLAFIHQNETYSNFTALRVTS